MRAGIEEQTGSPRSLYTDPHTSFPAAFIGETNLIPGTFVESGSAGISVDTALGRLRAAKMYGNFKKGDQVAISVRPEAVKLSGNANDNRLVPKLAEGIY